MPFGLLNFFSSLCVSVDGHKSAANTALGITDKAWPVGKFTNIESTNDED